MLQGGTWGLQGTLWAGGCSIPSLPGWPWSPQHLEQQREVSGNLWAPEFILGAEPSQCSRALIAQEPPAENSPGSP